MPRKNFVVDAEVQAAIDSICKRYKLSKEADAIRLALVVLAASPRLKLPPGIAPTYRPGRPRREG